jgi:hypothetical protein
MNKTVGFAARRAASACVSVLLLCASATLLTAQTLKIAEPKDGTVVNPGQTITVVVEASPPLTFRAIIIVGTDVIGFSQNLFAPPYRFSMTIPPRARPRRYGLTADGTMEPGKGTTSQRVEILVERPDDPVSLSAETSVLGFERPGDQYSMRIVAAFPDGSSVDVSESSHITYQSDAPSVAAVDACGLVTAVAPGSAQITIRYKGKSTVVPVIVGKAPSKK